MKKFPLILPSKPYVEIDNELMMHQGYIEFYIRVVLGYQKDITQDIVKDNLQNTLNWIKSGKMRKSFQNSKNRKFFTSRIVFDLFKMAYPIEIKQKALGLDIDIKKSTLVKLDKIQRKIFNLSKDEIFNFSGWERTNKINPKEVKKENVDSFIKGYFDFLGGLFDKADMLDERKAILKAKEKYPLNIEFIGENSINSFDDGTMRLSTPLDRTLIHETTHYIHYLVRKSIKKELEKGRQKLVKYNEGLANFMCFNCLDAVLKNDIDLISADFYHKNLYGPLITGQIKASKEKDQDIKYNKKVFFNNKVLKRLTEKRQEIAYQRIYRFAPLKQKGGIKVMYWKELSYGVGYIKVYKDIFSNIKNIKKLLKAKSDYINCLDNHNDKDSNSGCYGGGCYSDCCNNNNGNKNCKAIDNIKVEKENLKRICNWFLYETKEKLF